MAQERREKAARERRDISQRDVAEAVGTSGANVSRWEAGQAIPGEEFLAKLATFFGVSRAWLRYGEGERVELPPHETRQRNGRVLTTRPEASEQTGTHGKRSGGSA